MMLLMSLGRYGTIKPPTVIFIGIFALLSIQMLNAVEWDSQGAARAFESARQKQNQITQIKNPSINQYLDCAETYRKVYVRDPHYKSAGEAIYTEGLIYQLIGDKFSKRNYYLAAIKRFSLLVKDYGGNPFCPDALLRLIAIYTKNIKDEAAAEDAYQRLRTQYKNSTASIKQIPKESNPNPPSLQVNPKQKPPPSEPAKPAEKSLVQEIKYQSERDHSLIVISLDSAAAYMKESLTQPDRIYFDIFNARTSANLYNRTIEVGNTLLKQIRIRQNKPEVVRVVFDLSEACPYSVSELQDPFRIVISLQHTGEKALREGASLNTPAEESVHDVAKQPEITAGQTATLETKQEKTRPVQAPPPIRASMLQASLAKKDPGKETQPVARSDENVIDVLHPTIETKKQQAEENFSKKPIDSPEHSNAVPLPVPATVRSADTQSLVKKQVIIETAKSLGLPDSKAVAAPIKVAEVRIPLPPKVVTLNNQHPPDSIAPNPTASPVEEESVNQPIAESKITGRSVELPELPQSKKPSPAIPLNQAKIQIPPQVAAGKKSGEPDKSSDSMMESRPTEIHNDESVSIKKDIFEESTPEDSPVILPSFSKSSSKTSRGDRTLTRMLGLKIGRIVLDPGHGGHDLGTVGPGGLLEKHLVLSIALDLKKQLQERLGAEVFLTRTTDRFVSLEERTAIANQYRADLFISIHANSSRHRSTSGVETYYLDFASTESAKEVAARENAISDSNVRDLEDLVKKIALADKSAESRELASLLQKKLYSESRKFSPGTNNRGVRTAPFIVLIGANMPSVLTEVAFLSNPKDEKRLKKRTNREYLVNALYSGIESYMKTLGSDLAHNQAASSK